MGGGKQETRGECGGAGAIHVFVSDAARARAQGMVRWCWPLLVQQDSLATDYPLSRWIIKVPGDATTAAASHVRNVKPGRTSEDVAFQKCTAVVRNGNGFELTYFMHP